MGCLGGSTTCDNAQIPASCRKPLFGPGVSLRTGNGNALGTLRSIDSFWYGRPEYCHPTRHPHQPLPNCAFSFCIRKRCHINARKEAQKWRTPPAGLVSGARIQGAIVTTLWAQTIYAPVRICCTNLAAGEDGHDLEDWLLAERQVKGTTFS